MSSPPTERESSTALITTFVTMHTFAWTCCLIIITTVVFSPEIHRQSTWINLTISWIIACFVYAFLLTTGELYKANPNPGICLFQAVLVDAVSSLVAGMMLALSLQLWFNLRSNPFKSTGTPQRRDTLLIVVPYVVPFIEFFATIGYAVQHPQEVALTKSGMFCGLTNPIFGRISFIYSAILMVPTASAQAVLWHYSYWNWYKLSKNNRNALATMVRLGLFTVFGIVGVLVSLLDLTNQVDLSVVNILESLPPVSFVLIFGLQQDLFRAWIFWLTCSSVPKPASGMWSRIRSIGTESYSTENEQRRPPSSSESTII
ncbi:hypothetical protein J3R30DRAFT_3700791 [Lentinula aciculospora]|uniref:Uncharacterized protein n=1 Tax=Lentinula aciculospora TaxID=153920 RepID=A0A9W9DQI0_9AGAR|nr:hypothetical protein J3R30DRAFT_3700791 [Lentinula aciculospora]